MNNSTSDDLAKILAETEALHTSAGITPASIESTDEELKKLDLMIARFGANIRADNDRIEELRANIRLHEESIAKNKSGLKAAQKQRAELASGQSAGSAKRFSFKGASSSSGSRTGRVI